MRGATASSRVGGWQSCDWDVGNGAVQICIPNDLLCKIAEFGLGADFQQFVCGQIAAMIPSISQVADEEEGDPPGEEAREIEWGAKEGPADCPVRFKLTFHGGSWYLRDLPLERDLRLRAEFSSPIPRVGPFITDSTHGIRFRILAREREKLLGARLWAPLLQAVQPALKQIRDLLRSGTLAKQLQVEIRVGAAKVSRYWTVSGFIPEAPGSRKNIVFALRPGTVAQE